MARSKLVLILILFLVLCGCVTSKWKTTLVSSGSLDDAINNAVTDFIHTSRLSKQDSMFSVDMYDMGSKMFRVGIIQASHNKIYTTVESEFEWVKDNTIPNSYTIRDGKLFYWQNPNKQLGQEIIEILKRYNQIDFSWRKKYDTPPSMIYERIEFVNYYFDKDDYRVYRKQKNGQNSYRITKRLERKIIKKW